MPKKKIVEEQTTGPDYLHIEEVEDLAQIDAPNWVPERVNPENYLSSGLTLLNLAATNDPDCFMEKGSYLWLAGIPGAGKSMLAMQLLAEAANNPNFDGYDLIYDDAEHGSLFDVPKMFGHKLANRIKPPAVDKTGRPVYSAQVEDFYFLLDDYQDAKKPFVYVLDSMDSLTSSASDDKFDENKDDRRAALEKGKDVKLTQGMGDGKAKVNSQNLRRVVNRLAENGSILVIISQLRDNITGYGDKFIPSGGKALKYYSHIEAWFTLGATLKRVIDGKERKFGQTSTVTIKRNRITGMKPSVDFPILAGYGISDMDSCLNWLCEEDRVVVPARITGLYKYPALGLELSRENMLREMENNFEPFKKDIVDTWYAILASISSNRKKKYS